MKATLVKGSHFPDDYNLEQADKRINEHISQFEQIESDAE